MAARKQKTKTASAKAPSEKAASAAGWNNTKVGTRWALLDSKDIEAMNGDRKKLAKALQKHYGFDDQRVHLELDQWLPKLGHKDVDYDA